jgi:hypothetical protein
MRFFFYGTLMDPGLLSWVLGRPIAPRKLVPALLRGYLRSKAQGLPYPMVLRDSTASVNAVALGGVTVIDFSAMKARTFL